MDEGRWGAAFMACSGPRASPTASCDHLLLPPKEWVHGKSRSPHSSSHRHKHTQQRGPPMTLQNHLLTNAIPLPMHHHIHFLNSPKNLSQNRTHFAQNLSHAATFFPLRGKKIYESLPTCRPLAIMLVSVMWTTKGAAKTHARARSYRSYVRASTAS